MPRKSIADQTPDMQTDHDVLIELRTEFRGFAERMSSDVQEIKTGQAMQIGKMDARLVALETWKQTKAADDRISLWEQAAELTRKSLNEERLVRVDAAVEWVDTYRSNWKWIMVSVSFVSGAFVYFIDHVLPMIRWK